MGWDGAVLPMALFKNHYKQPEYKVGELIIVTRVIVVVPEPKYQKSFGALELKSTDNGTVKSAPASMRLGFACAPDILLTPLDELQEQQIASSVEGRVMGLSVSSLESLKTWLNTRILPEKFTFYIADATNTLVSVNVNKADVHPRGFGDLLKILRENGTGPADKQQEMQVIRLHNVEIREESNLSNQVCFTFLTSAHDNTETSDELLDHDFNDGHIHANFNIDHGDVTKRIYNFASNAA
jgi:hypothetical protein